jgi:hypothetical protein
VTRLSALAEPNRHHADLGVVVGDFEPAELAVAAAGEEPGMDEVAERACARVKQSCDLVLGQIAHDRGVDGAEGLDPPPGIVAWYRTAAPGVVERGL